MNKIHYKLLQIVTNLDITINHDIHNKKHIMIRHDSDVKIDIIMKMMIVLFYLTDGL
jgi:hypothetical protein